MSYFPIRTTCCVVLATVIVSTAGHFLVSGQDPQRAEGALPRVRCFKCEGTSMLEALLLLGQQEHVPFGVEYLDLEAVQKPISVNLFQTTFAEALKKILSHGKGYSWQLERGVVTVGHAGVRRKTALDQVVAEFSTRKCSIQEANNALRMTLYNQLYPQVRGTVGEYNPGNFHVVLGPLEVHNASVREILNRLVSERVDAAWVVQVPSDHLNQLPPEGLWRIVEYDAPDFRQEINAVRQSLFAYGPPPPARDAH